MQMRARPLSPLSWPRSRPGHAVYRWWWLVAFFHLPMVPITPPNCSSSAPAVRSALCTHGAIPAQSCQCGAQPRRRAGFLTILGCNCVRARPPFGSSTLCTRASLHRPPGRDMCSILAQTSSSPSMRQPVTVPIFFFNFVCNSLRHFACNRGFWTIRPSAAHRRAAGDSDTRP